MTIFSRISNWHLPANLKASFQKDGYVILRNRFTQVERDGLINSVMEVKNWPNIPNRHMHYEEVDRNGNRILTITENFVDYHKQLGQLLRSNVLAKLVEELTGKPMVLFKASPALHEGIWYSERSSLFHQEKIVYKSPGGGGFPAHTDAPSYQHIGPDSFQSLAMAVEPAKLENGCVEVVPGSHLLSDIPTRPDQCIDDDWCAKQDWVPVELDTGDIFIFSSLLVHRSANNDSKLGRAMLYATFNPIREGGDRRHEYYKHRRAEWPATFEREVGKSYTEGRDRYAWGTPMITVEGAA
ncbi:PhyH-domain-containing protein [Calocera cornea HHB12733]|uniref:PhyH-domain-containing protein n=1 Tax=Calocera cornea HHB12733 TaxID=1353952 RepID=A0A165E807_9BASI|nr:PhyH-domain-containing protein [Calocera cornea HHB12733]